MTGHYLARFDDIFPTMNWPVWDGVEELLRKNGIAPILREVVLKHYSVDVLAPIFAATSRRYSR